MGVIYYKDKKYGGGGGSGAIIGTITLSADWAETDTGSGIFAQSVEIPGVTISDRSMINLQPSATTLKTMIESGIYAINVANDNGSLTAYAIGMKPQESFTVQCTVIDAVIDATGEVAGDGSVYPDGDETSW